MSTLLIEGGTVVSADGEAKGNVLIRHGRVVWVGDPAEGEATDGLPEVRIDATGMFVFPGAVDSHVHLSHPIDSLGIHTADDFYSGSLAGACGGVTGFVDFALQRSGDTLASTVEHRIREIESHAVTDFGTHVIVTDPRPQVLEEIPGLVEAGFPSFKLFMTYGDKRVTDRDIESILRRTGPAGGLVFVHCEDDALVTGLRERFANAGQTAPHFHAKSRPPEAEEMAVARLVALSRNTGSPVFVGHVTTAGAVEAIRGAKREGLAVFGETCPHYLAFQEDVYALDLPFERAAGHVCSPPMRTAEHTAAVWEGLEDGTLSIVTSDHAPFRMADQKSMGASDFRRIPNGLPGIETRLGVLWTLGVAAGRISRSRFVELVSTGPARLFGLTGKGRLEPGADGDVVVWDPAMRGHWTAEALHSATDYSPYEGVAYSGGVAYTVSRGDVIWDGQAFRGDRGRGRLMERIPSIPSVPSIPTS